MKQETKRRIDLVGEAIAQFFCRSVSKKEQLRREARLREQIEAPFEPVFRFAVASDIHIQTDNPDSADRLRELFATAYAYAERCPTHKTLDAVALVGDFTDGGSQPQYDILKGILKDCLRSETTLFTVMGNHEHGNLDTEGYTKNLDPRLDKHDVIGGFHFLGLAPLPKDTWHKPQQLLWMAKELKKAKRAAPNKPIFTFQHGHIWKTVYVSRSWYTQMGLPLHIVFSRYPQIINFSGHSHGPINHPLTVWQSRCTMFGTGTLKYFEMERDINTDTVPAGSENAAQYLIVEADAQNRVRVLPFNLLTRDFFKTPANTDDPDRQLVYFVENPADRKTFAYTAARKKTDAAPCFAPDAKIAAASPTPDSVSVTFDQAQSDVCVYGYLLRFYEEAHPKKAALSEAIFSEYYFEPMPRQRTCTVSGLKSDTRYTVRVYPMNAWRKKGKPLETEFTTSKR